MQCIKDCSSSSRDKPENGSGMDCEIFRQQCFPPAAGARDDTERFIRDLESGIPVSLLAAPAVSGSFADYRQVFGYLQSLGVRSFHNVLLRADITVWAYIELLKGSSPAAFLSSPCAAVTDYIRRYKPQLEPHLMPVYSPLLCASIYLRKYRKLTNRLAFLSPCVAKRKEIRSQDTNGYNITINRLQQHLAAKQVNLSRYPAVDFDDRQEGTGRTLGIYGGISESLAAHLPACRFAKISGPDKVYRWLDEYERLASANEPLPHFAEIYNCRAGCEGGTGINQKQKQGLEAVDQKWFAQDPAAAGRNRQAATELFTVFKKNLRLPDFIV